VKKRKQEDGWEQSRNCAETGGMGMNLCGSCGGMGTNPVGKDRDGSENCRDE